MKATSFCRQRSLLCALLLFVVTVIALLTVTLTQLDLEQFRQRLTQELSQILQQPVQMGTLHLTYQQGLAVDIHNLNIGDKKNLDIHVPQMTGVLRLQPLLMGDFLFDRVVLTEPQLNIVIPEASGSERREPAVSTTAKLFKRFGLSLLTIRHATLDLTEEQPRDKQIPSRIENLNLVLRGWSAEQTGYLVVSGVLPEQTGQFTIEADLPTPAQLSDWRQQPLSIKANLKNISRDLLPETLTQHLPEQIDASLRLSGPPVTGSNLYGQISDSLSGNQLLTAEGRWLSADQTDRIQELQISLFNIPFTGDLQISRTDDSPQIKGSLKAENIELPSLLKRWSHPQAARLVSGAVKSAEIQFRNNDNREPGASSDQSFQYQAHFVLEDGRWALNETDHLEQISFEIKLDQQSLELYNGKSQLLNQDLAFHGEVHNWSTAPLFTLSAITQSETASLLQLFKDSLPEALILEGPVLTTLTLEGDQDQIRGELQINFDELFGQFEPLIIKQPNQKGLLNLKGIWQPGEIQLEQVNLDFVDLHIQGTSVIPLGENDQPFHLHLNNIDLAALGLHSPLLQSLKARGSLEVNLQRQPTGEIQGELQLNNVGAYLTWVIAEINAVNGKVSFNNLGLDFENLDAQLGKSPIQVDGNLRNWENFLLALQVHGNEIRARDLVFANKEMKVYDVDGKLLINKGGIIFDPVQVRLENGTDAKVSGYVRDFSQPDTYLEIDSLQHADILEVINLFVGPPKAIPHKKTKTKQARPVRILARAAQGTLGGLNFQQAEGMIVSSAGLFTLYPLRFSHKDGFCLARVELDQGRLKISGHLEDFDAGVLHSEALQARGLVAGTLRGDFYLEGNGTGKQFWASSRGGAHLEIRDGTLRKFRSLAQVLSLLDVSQLFALKLPDMSRKGMPFSLLTASVKLEDGLISTENLQIISSAMNMSLIGSRNIVTDTIDMTVGVKPLNTVDKIITAIPVAGWILTGDEKALLTAHFEVKGPASDPEVTAIPATSLSKTVLGLLKRTLGLPGTLITDPGKLFSAGGETSQSVTVPENHLQPEEQEELDKVDIKEPQIE